MAPVPSPTVTFRWRNTAPSNFLFAPNVDCKLASNSTFYTLHRYLAQLHIIIVSTFSHWLDFLSLVWGDIMIDALLLCQRCRLPWFVSVSLPAALHLALIKPSVLSNLFFPSLHCISFHPATKFFFFFFFFWVCNVLLMFLLSGRCRFCLLCLLVYTSCLTIRILTFPLPATRYCFFFLFGLVCKWYDVHVYTFKFALLRFHSFFLYPLITNFRSFALLFSFLLVAVVPRSGIYPIVLL